MSAWRLLIVGASAAAALVVGLSAQAKPEPTTLEALMTAVANPLNVDADIH